MSSIHLVSQKYWRVTLISHSFAIEVHWDRLCRILTIGIPFVALEIFFNGNPMRIKESK